MLRRGFLKSLFLGASASAVSIANAAEQVPTGETDINAEIEALLRQTETAWDSQDTEQLRDLWDVDDSQPYYLAGEQDDWFIGWDAINQYLAPRGVPKVTEAIRVRFYDVKARLLSPDLAFAAYWMRTDMKLIFSPKPFGSDNRVSSVFRRKSDGWRYLCYAEAFQAPNMYFQKLFEKDVSSDYQSFYEEVMKK
jgi:hypothetical protein